MNVLKDYKEYFATQAPPPAKKAPAPAEPAFDVEDIANRLYIVFEIAKETPNISSFVLEDLIDVIELLVPGYLQDAMPK